MNDPMSDEVLRDYERGFKVEGELRGIDVCREVRRLRQEVKEAEKEQLAIYDDVVIPMERTIEADREAMLRFQRCDSQGLCTDCHAILRTRLEAKDD